MTNNRRGHRNFPRPTERHLDTYAIIESPRDECTMGACRLVDGVMGATGELLDGQIGPGLQFGYIDDDGNRHKYAETYLFTTHSFAALIHSSQRLLHLMPTQFQRELIINLRQLRQALG